MIKGTELNPSELRANNLVYYNGTNGPIHNINKIDALDIHLMSQKESYLKMHEPIPLSEEWLVKSGAEKLEFNTIYVLERFKLIWKESYKYWYVVDYETGVYLSKIEFLHEWQNFYFVMQGKELTFK